MKSIPVGEFSRLGPSAALITTTSDAFHMSIMILRGIGRAVMAICSKERSAAQ